MAPVHNKGDMLKDRRRADLPKFVHQTTKSLSQLAIHPQRVVCVYIRFEIMPKELAHEGHRMGQALDAGVHEAGVAKVTQAC